MKQASADRGPSLTPHRSRRRAISRAPWRFGAVLALVTIALLAFAGCSKPDASYSTSPSALALLGTTEGDVDYAPAGPPPEPMPDPDGWKLDLGNARYEDLENFDAAIQVVALLIAEPAGRMEIWITGPDGPVMRWSGGPTQSYSGTLCFMIALEEDGAAIPLVEGKQYEVRIAFYDESGEVIAARSVRVAGTVPELEGDLPGDDATAGRVLLACPRAPL